MSALEQPSICADNYAFIDSADKLNVIRRPHINLAVWQREADAEMKPIIQHLTKEAFALEYHVDVGNVSNTLLESLNAPPSYDQSRYRLIADIQKLTLLFADYANTHSIRLILESVHDVPCPKFHQDNITLRLICSYAGVGTDWLENSNVNPHPNCCGGSMVLDESRIQQLAPFDVALMKGKLWPKNDMGIYHRSPELKPGEPRLVVKMDVAK